MVAVVTSTQVEPGGVRSNSLPMGMVPSPFLELLKQTVGILPASMPRVAVADRAVPFAWKVVRFPLLVPCRLREEMA